ncbi:MAG: hypothetical protein HC769_16900 [Cyanobacteria bacterium CRU_2_1]|nr:hypothetical protein [Cyanobacteria bacterium RU_5_0]NJR60357.1 hypothetical protein [Cyanobacteria bacterium CRU_2_1]
MRDLKRSSGEISSMQTGLKSSRNPILLRCCHTSAGGQPTAKEFGHGSILILLFVTQYKN